MDEPSGAAQASRIGNGAPTTEESERPTALMCGDCGVTLLVVKPCPDDGLGVFRCGCGAEIYPSDSGA